MLLIFCFIELKALLIIASIGLNLLGVIFHFNNKFLIFFLLTSFVNAEKCFEKLDLKFEHLSL